VENISAKLHAISNIKEGSTTKKSDKKKSDKKKSDNHGKKSSESDQPRYANTMYFFAGEYSKENDDMKKFYTNEQEEDAKKGFEESGTVKPSDPKVLRKKIGLCIWKNLGQKKREEIKSSFNLWKKELNKESTQTANVEPHTPTKGLPASTQADE